MKKINETTSSGSIAPMSSGIGQAITRDSSIYGNTPKTSMLAGKKTKKKYANSLTEGEMKEIHYDLEYLSDQAFKSKYNATKDAIQQKFSTKPADKTLYLHRLIGRFPDGRRERFTATIPSKESQKAIEYIRAKHPDLANLKYIELMGKAGPVWYKKTPNNVSEGIELTKKCIADNKLQLGWHIEGLNENNMYESSWHENGIIPAKKAEPTNANFDVELNPGDRVVHKVYGPGTLVDTSGKFVKVEFDRPHSRLPENRIVTLQPGTLHKAGGYRTEIAEDDLLSPNKMSPADFMYKNKTNDVKENAKSILVNVSKNSQEVLTKLEKMNEIPAWMISRLGALNGELESIQQYIQSSQTNSSLMDKTSESSIMKGITSRR